MSSPHPEGLDLVRVARAVHFAARKHRDQRRKGASAEPYFNHLADVGQMVAEATGGRDPIAVLGALLHDTIEDTGTTADELEAEFGAEVSRLVVEVTDDKRLPKAERKRLQVLNASHKSDRAKMVKIADKISNLRSITDSPPIDWNPARKREYFEWARCVVEGCRGVSPWLEERFDDAYRMGIAKLDATSDP
jgi:guanosine-3',5'-bis(diphosphate) 3'-pyrophosphohydrolase